MSAPEEQDPLWIDAETTVAASFHDRPAAGPSDCESTKPKSQLVDDVDFFLNGFATLTPVSLD